MRNISKAKDVFKIGCLIISFKNFSKYKFINFNVSGSNYFSYIYIKGGTGINGNSIYNVLYNHLKSVSVQMTLKFLLGTDNVNDNDLPEKIPPSIISIASIII